LDIHFSRWAPEELGLEKKPDPKKNSFALRKDRAASTLKLRTTGKPITSHAGRRVEYNRVFHERVPFAIGHLTRSLLLNTQHRPWETAHVRKPETKIAPGGRQWNLFGSPA
jgi:hypothetical protein